jgi:DnaJ-domain-containing protein 1
MGSVKAKVQAWQHIYTSVERDQSPHDRAGFQTLFHSKSGLTEAEVKEMEARLVYFLSDIEPVKRLCSTISTGKIMAAQIVHLAEPDRLGRKGRYLAHNLVFEAQAFERIDSDPFLVFHQFPFITTVAKALEVGDLRTGDVPPVSFEIALEPTHGIEAAKTWPARDLRDLALLALRADRLASERLSVAFIGEPADVESALEVVLLAVPTSLRPRCGFDTYFHGCNPVSIYYWAIGLLESPGNRRLVRVDAQSQCLDGDVASLPETAYERWAAACIEEHKLETLGRYRNHALALCEWLEGRATTDSLIAGAPVEVVGSVFQANHDLVQKLLHTKLKEALPDILVHRAFQHLGSQTTELLGQLRRRFRLSDLMEALYRAYESQEFRAPEPEEIQAIDWLLRRDDHAFLRLLHVCWTDRRDELHRELQLLNDDQYQRFVQTALRFGFVEAWALPVPGRGNAFLDVYLDSTGSAKPSLTALVRALLRAREAGCLERLTPYVQAQPEQELRALARIIAKRSAIPDPFRHAVGDAVAALPARRTGLLAQLVDDWATWFER